MSESQPPAERRASRREGLDRPVRIDTREGSQPGRLTSLSRVGAFVIVEEPLAPGASVSIVISMVAGKGLVLHGRVVRQGASGSAEGMGITFGAMPPATHAAVEELLLSLE
jgi:hypothetical protein